MAHPPDSNFSFTYVAFCDVQHAATSRRGEFHVADRVRGPAAPKAAGTDDAHSNRAVQSRRDLLKGFEFLLGRARRVATPRTPPTQPSDRSFFALSPNIKQRRATGPMQRDYFHVEKRDVAVDAFGFRFIMRTAKLGRSIFSPHSNTMQRGFY